MLSDADVFALRDAYLAEHPEIERMQRQIAHYEWMQRQLNPIRILEQVWHDGVLVSQRDVTPPDPEPPLE